MHLRIGVKTSSVSLSSRIWWGTSLFAASIFTPLQFTPRLTHWVIHINFTVPIKAHCTLCKISILLHAYFFTTYILYLVRFIKHSTQVHLLLKYSHLQVQLLPNHLNFQTPSPDSHNHFLWLPHGGVYTLNMNYSSMLYLHPGIQLIMDLHFVDLTLPLLLLSYRIKQDFLKHPYVHFSLKPILPHLLTLQTSLYNQLYVSLKETLRSQLQNLPMSETWKTIAHLAPLT